MLGRLQGAFEAQRRSVVNASHELRTPLAMMRTSLDVALERLYNRDGSGLGLSIAKAVAAALGGTLTLHARSAGGLQVVVELPARPPR